MLLPVCLIGPGRRGGTRLPVAAAEAFTSEPFHAFFGFVPFQDVLGAGGVHNFLLMGV